MNFCKHLAFAVFFRIALFQSFGQYAIGSELLEEIIQKTIMASNFNTDERKWMLKEHWKSQNDEIVRTNWVQTFGTLSPKRQTIYRICDKFDATGSTLNVPKIGRPQKMCT
ncbi:putative mariner [Nephila pilipes]|uniref:Putative mariner n=1 Tax=Nephila pilipes TaxID=299642 RepID=A0A8X6Q8T6_NEPPI|nr:putative mariner [Nephila pilipes]